MALLHDIITKKPKELVHKMLLSRNDPIVAEELWPESIKWDRKADKIKDSGYIYLRGKDLQIRKPENEGVKPF